MQVKNFKVTRKGIFKSQFLFFWGGGGEFRSFYLGAVNFEQFCFWGIWHLLLDEQECLPSPTPQERELCSAVISSDHRLNCFVVNKSTKTKFLNSLQLQKRVQKSVSSPCQSLYKFIVRTECNPFSISNVITRATKLYTGTCAEQNRRSVSLNCSQKDAIQKSTFPELIFRNSWKIS